MLSYNPSEFLVSIRELQRLSTQDVSDFIERLEIIYSKNLKAPLDCHFIRQADHSLARVRRGKKGVPRGKKFEQELVADSGYASAEEDGSRDINGGAAISTESLRLIKADPYERGFTIRWLTGFISRSSTWIPSSCDPDFYEEEESEREVLVEKAANLLSCCAGLEEPDGDASLTRIFDFPLGVTAGSSDSKKIFVELNDAPLSSDDHSSVGLQSWASSVIMARMLAESPNVFGLVQRERQPIRILELGAGTGLLSIAAAKVLAEYMQPSSIVATDYHPDVLSNLVRNVETNFPNQECYPVVVRTLDWQFPSYETPCDGPFDVILAADVIYNISHATWIKSCVQRLLRQPTPESPEGGVFWMTIPIRTTGRHEGLDATVHQVFDLVSTEEDRMRLSGQLACVELRELERSQGVGRADETGYKCFKICWV